MAGTFAGVSILLKEAYLNTEEPRYNHSNRPQDSAIKKILKL